MSRFALCIFIIAVLSLSLASEQAYAEANNDSGSGVHITRSFSALPGLPISARVAGDECNFTAECKSQYGGRATDCQNSRSDNSVCICGSSPCRDGGGQTPSGSFPGRFNLSQDLFLAFYDNRPDADDIHSQAGVATMLEDRRFDNIDFYSVLGAYGKQGGAFLNSTSVMNLCFGSANWTNAHTKDGANWQASLQRVESRVNRALARGGDVWIMEAGQSDFSADLVRKLKAKSSSLNTRARIHIVQHSDYNEKETTPADLNYIRANTDYNKIPDGNAFNNGSPQFLTRSDTRWALATSLPRVGACWAEARRVADRNNFSGNGHYENPAIEAGGFDFSDVVEATWIFGFNSLRNVDAFFTEFPKLNGDGGGDSDGMQTETAFMPAIYLLLAEE